MKKIIPIILALLLASMLVSPALAAVTVGTVRFDGECTTAHYTASSGTITLDLVAVKEFNISVQGYTAVTLDINASLFQITRDANTTNTSWDITNASYNTLAEIMTQLDARSDVTVSEYDAYLGSRVCTAIIDVAAQDINGTTVYTVLTTTAPTFTVASYPTFGQMETALEGIPTLTVAWSTAMINEKKARLATSTLDDLTKTTIEGATINMTAGGTVSELHSPYYKISGTTIDDVLFCLQLYEPTKWYPIYSDGTALIVIGGP